MCSVDTTQDKRKGSSIICYYSSAHHTCLETLCVCTLGCHSNPSSVLCSSMLQLSLLFIILPPLDDGWGQRMGVSSARDCIVRSDGVS